MLSYFAETPRKYISQCFPIAGVAFSNENIATSTKNKCFPCPLLVNMHGNTNADHVVLSEQGQFHPPT